MMTKKQEVSSREQKIKGFQNKQQSIMEKKNTLCGSNIMNCLIQ